MELNLADWCFRVDVAETFHRTTQNSLDHCTCGYCRNYYESAPLAHPELPAFLSQFGVEFNGPSEVMPFLPTYLLVCYRVQGEIVRHGTEPL